MRYEIDAILRRLSRRDFLCTMTAVSAGAAILHSLPAYAHPKASPTVDYSSVIAQIKQLLPVAMRLKDITGASIALVDGDTIVWSGGFGYTDRSQKVKVTAQTLFHVGSISKSFTALGVLRAVDKGLLSLDQPVKKYLPWFRVNSRFGAAEAERITLRHLLSHHSGLGTWSPVGNPSDPKYQTRAFEEVVRSTTDSWLKFPAGERFEYSNQGINLAGYALEAAAAKPFAELMRDEILAPLGMAASTFHQAEATRKPECAVGYLGKRPVPMVNGIVHPQIAAGGLFASANDLAQFVIFHLQGGAGGGKQILPSKLLQEMFAPQFTARSQPSGYGLGIYKAMQNSTVRLSHGGLGYGISAHYRLLPEHRIGVALLTNQDAAHNAPALASRVIELMLTAKLGALPENSSLKPTDRPLVTLDATLDATLDETALRRLEGTYLLYEGILFRFRYEKGNLFHIIGDERRKLNAHSPTEFTAGSCRYKFLLLEDGKPKGVQISDPYYDPQTAENSVLYLPVNDTRGEARGANKPEWSRRAGKYFGTFIGDSSEVTVSLENGYLYINGELKLTEIKTDFFVTADGEAVIFTDEQLSVGNKLYGKRK